MKDDLHLNSMHIKAAGRFVDELEDGHANRPTN